MQIAYCSDLHLEFADCELVGTGDVLVLAGDIMLAADVSNYPWSSLDSVRENQRNASYLRSSRYRDFFVRASNKFSKVLYICGNHEFYHSDINLARAVLTANLKELDNVKLLENSVIEILGVKFVAATLWTDLSNPIDSLVVGRGLNDYKTIGLGERVLHPRDTTELFKVSREFISNSQAMIVITHHAPSYQSIGSNYVSSELSAAYASDLSEVILNLNPELWIHGHCHDPAEYKIGATRVSTNPRGYSREKTNVNLKTHTYSRIRTDLSK